VLPDPKDFSAKEEGVRRTEIDPFRTVDALRYGFVICTGCGYEREKITLQDMIWALLVEAARVERHLPGAGGVGFPLAWPEIWRSAADIKFKRNARIEAGMDEFDGERRTFTPRPTAAQISRHDEVIVWLRFCHGVDKIQAVTVLWGRASGVPYDELRKQTGLSIARLRSLKSEQLKAIAKRLKQELNAGQLASAFHA